MDIAQNIAHLLKEEPNKLQRESLKIYLQQRQREVQTKILAIAKKYGVKNIIDMDNKLKEGKLSEDCLEEYQELDALEAETDRLTQAFQIIK